jgi:ABC-type dipeptide/oligopeptide/nickel transport system permease component
MLGYLTRRVALSIVVLLGIAAITFLIVHLIPGDPARIELGRHASPRAVAQLRSELGLDDSLGSQFVQYLGDISHGDFGESIIVHAPASEVIVNRLAPTALLMWYGVTIAFLIGVPMAIIAALRPGGLADSLIRLFTTFSFAMPSFWLGLMLALTLGLSLKLFPVSGYETGVSGFFRTLTLPALTLGLALLVIVVRNLRSSLVSVLSSDYIESARARGFSEWRVVGKHAMRNSVIGTVTIVASLFGYVVGVVIVVEAVFQIPGAGSLLVQAVQKRDYPLIEGLTLLAGATVVLVGLCTDLFHAAIDPRVRLEASGE